MAHRRDDTILGCGLDVVAPGDPTRERPAWGLDDWVALEAVHSAVAEADGRAPTSVVQDETLALIRSLVDEGLLRFGDLATANQEFSAWAAHSMNRSNVSAMSTYLTSMMRTCGLGTAGST